MPMELYRRALPATCIAFSSAEGKTIFREALDAGHMESYFLLAPQFRTQDDPAFCGLATLVMVLNALEIDPQRVWKGPWRWYHEEMLECCIPVDEVRRKGITYEQFSCLAECNGLAVVQEARVGPDQPPDAFRAAVAAAAASDRRVLVASYSRKVLQQTGSGHFTTIGGYHAGRDLLLVLDTARFKYPPHWVSLSLLWEAMKLEDPETGQPRGYFLLERADRSRLTFFRPHENLSGMLMGGHCLEGSLNARAREAWRVWVDWVRERRPAAAGREEAAAGAARAVLAAFRAAEYRLFFLRPLVRCVDADRSSAMGLLDSQYAKEVVRELQEDAEWPHAAEAVEGNTCKAESSIPIFQASVVALLMAFPFSGCGEGTWGELLAKCAVESEAEVEKEKMEEVTQEVQRLREILSSLMKF